MDSGDEKVQLRAARDALHIAFDKSKATLADEKASPEQKEDDYRAALRAHERYIELRLPHETSYKAKLQSAPTDAAERAAYDAYKMFSAQFPDPGPPQAP